MSAGATNQNRVEAARWLKTAVADLKAARWNAQGEFFNLACFTAQQAAEKALKALLLSTGERDVRGHSVLSLLERAVTLRPELSALRADCRVLDRYYIPTRYPDALPEGSPVEAFGSEDAEDALRRSEKIIIAVQKALEEDGHAWPTCPGRS
ncbi:MAG TPA: HEPN domain-containing protein [Firmicutes bacterium]|nr:HEPN domain-containing protein [Bacillota bacterium]